jgi:RNA polymerase sigma-70 factor (ECF subfamily)
METETELLNAARMLSKDAFVKIFDLYAQPLYRYALRLCGDPVIADQIVGDVFAKLLDLFSSGHGPSVYLRSYLYETVYHRIIDEARSSRHKAPLEAVDWFRQDVQAGHISLEDHVLFKQILHIIQNNLTDDQRHVIILRFLEGFSLRETGAIIGKTEDHVKVIQTRAIAKLRQALNDKGAGTALPFPRPGEQSKPLSI